MTMALGSTLSSALPASLTRQELRHELQAFRGNLSNDIREICDRLRDSIRTDLQRQLNEKKDSRADIWKERLTLQDVGESGFLAAPSTPTQTRTVLVQPRKAEVPRSQSLSPKAEFRKASGTPKDFPSSASSSQLRQAGESEPPEDEDEASYVELLARARQRRSRFDDAENTSRWKAHRRMPKPTEPNMTFSKILLACAGVAMAADMPEHCKTLKPLPEKAEICEPTAQVLGDLDPSSHCVVYSVMENKSLDPHRNGSFSGFDVAMRLRPPNLLFRGSSKSCNEFCTEQGAKCAKAVDDLRVRKPCQYNFNSPVDCETSNYYDVHCICEVEVEEPPKNDCEYLLPLTGKNEKECTKGYFTQELKDDGKNCVALARLYKSAVVASISISISIVIVVIVMVMVIVIAIAIAIVITIITTTIIMIIIIRITIIIIIIIMSIITIIFRIIIIIAIIANTSFINITHMTFATIIDIAGGAPATSGAKARVRLAWMPWTTLISEWAAKVIMTRRKRSIARAPASWIFIASETCLDFSGPLQDKDGFPELVELDGPTAAITVEPKSVLGTETTTTTTPGCDSLLPFANPGEKLCTEGSLVEALEDCSQNVSLRSYLNQDRPKVSSLINYGYLPEDGGQNCVAYAVLGKKSSCNDFCEARNSVCVDAIDNKVIGESCEYDTEEQVACNMKHFFDMHCVCRKPFQEGCGTVQLCDEVCNITYIGDTHKARCLQHCASDAEKFLDFTKGWCGAGEFCQVDEEVALLQRKVGKSEHAPVPCRTADEFCSGLCSSLGYLANCEHKCMSVAHSLKVLTNRFCTDCVEPLKDDE
eukprot:s2_g24.t1